MKIIKASAGSGKTYRLSHTYIDSLLSSDDPFAYRHLLAVTFTNKATAEMKERILKDLREAARTDPRARHYLVRILHDYGAFGVSTIDRFFQQTLRAFSREIGQFSSYQVQLDREQLVGESVDMVLDGLEEGDTLKWLTTGARKDLERTGRFSLENRLTEMATSLRELPEGSTILPQKQLESLDRFCSELIGNFEESISKAAHDILDTCHNAGIEPEDTSSGWLGAIRHYLNAGDDIERPTDSFLARAADSSKWFAKANMHLLAGLEAPLGDAADTAEE